MFFQRLFFSESVCIVTFRMIWDIRIVPTGFEYYFRLNIRTSDYIPNNETSWRPTVSCRPNSNVETPTNELLGSARPLLAMIFHHNAYNHQNSFQFNPLGPQKPKLRHTIIDTLSLDAWLVTFGSMKSGLNCCKPAYLCCTKYDNTPTRNQCITHYSFVGSKLNKQLSPKYWKYS